MAVPALTNNSPSAGSISWGAFNIQYQGVSYPINAGSTSSRWVWWRFNGGSHVIEAGADIPTNLTDDDLVLFGNKNGVGARIQSSTLIDGELIVDGSIFAEAIAANQISSTKIATEGLDAGVIRFGTMSGDRISASSITADKLTVGAIGPSSIVNGGFEDDGWWVKGASATRIAAAAASGGFGMRLTASGSPGLTSPNIPIAAGDQIIGVISAKAVTQTTGLYFRMSWRNASNGEIGITDAVGNAALPTSWSDYAGSFGTAPAGTTSGIVQIYNTSGTVDIDDIDISPVIISARIADGAITAAKIQAGTITANEISSGAVTTTKLAASAVTATTIASGAVTTAKLVASAVTATEIASGAIITAKLAASAVTANEITSGAITTAKLAAGAVTAATIASGTITATQIAAGTITTSLLAAGAITADKLDATAINGKTITGSVIRTSSGASFMELANIESGGSLRGYTGFNTGTYGETASGLPPYLNAGQTVNIPGYSSQTGRNHPYATLTGGRWAASGAGVIRVVGASTTGDDGYIELSGNTMVFSPTNGGLTLDGSSAYQAKLRSVNSSVAWEGTRVVIGTNLYNGTPSTGNLNNIFANRLFANNTTPGSATSDRRIKKNIEPVSSALEILEHVEIYSYNPYDDPENTHYGVIAQEIAEILPDSVYDNGIRHDEEDDTLLGVNYGDIYALGLAALKELQVEVQDLRKLVKEMA